MQLEALNLHGFTVDEAMVRFVAAYNRLLASSKGKQVVALQVIHGKGRAGVGGLRETLRDYLATQGSRIAGFDAELALKGADYVLDVKGASVKLLYMYGEDALRNPGCTVVVPKRRLSVSHDWIRYTY